MACGDVHMHVRARRALQDTVTAIRLNTTVAEAGFALHPNGERHLRRIDDLATIYPRALLDASQRIASLNDADLNLMNQKLDQLPAGGDAFLAVIGIVFIVLLILEITGVIDIFKKV